MIRGIFPQDQFLWLVSIPAVIWLDFWLPPVRPLPYRLFTVTGDGDLQMELPVAQWEAALGAKVSVPTLDGSAELTIPPATQGGRWLRLRGQGTNRRSGDRGDEYVRLKIVNPSSLSPEERSLYEQLAEVSRFDARTLLPGGGR